LLWSNVALWDIGYGEKRGFLYIPRRIVVETFIGLFSGNADRKPH